VLMDPSRLQQALTNLLVNSRDAMAEGGRIEIGVDAVYVPPDTRAPVHEMPPGTWLRITVADTGDGIAPDILPHIFEPFYTTKAPGRGSGLGLAQVYGIVRQHDGYITAGNRAEGGAVIRLYLPLVRNPADAERDGLPAGAEITPATVLVIEPNPVTAETISATLSGLGYRVLTVPDGNAAIELAQHLDSHIDLAISHLDPPSDEGDPPSDEVADTEGLDFFHALRALRPNLRLIITHDASFKDVKIDLTEPGIVGRLQKPFTVSDIAAKVASVISPPLRGRRG
jgi:two-component system cell cycle sensor histidine kinase/response regulator CckA